MLSHPMFLHAVPASKKALSAGIISLWRSKDTGILYFSHFECMFNGYYKKLQHLNIWYILTEKSFSLPITFKSLMFSNKSTLILNFHTSVYL